MSFFSIITPTYKRADKLQRAIDSVMSQTSGDFEMIIVNDSPAVFLYSPDYLYVISNDLRGVEPIQITESADHFRTVSKWYMKTARVLK